jgi:8-oxo-(d)GTP phosphatase
VTRGAENLATEAGDGEHEDVELPVRSAALVCWRPGRDRRNRGFDVLVARSGPDDPNGWALPRETKAPRETLPQTAVRALTGRRAGTVRLVPRLARPLYDSQGTTFWAARLRERDSAAPPGGASSEELTWMPAEKSDDVLASPDDRAALTIAVEAAAHRQLDTRPLIVVRHAKARPRSRWSHADADRPLVDLGRRQSLALAALLECWHPEYLLSSPWRRCVDTLMPYAGTHKLRIRTRGGLSEQAHRSSPGKAERHLRATLARWEATLICTHRPVLPTVLGQIELRAVPSTRTAFPTEDPYLAPAEFLVAHVVPRAKARVPRVIAVELHRPIL